MSEIKLDKIATFIETTNMGIDIKFTIQNGKLISIHDADKNSFHDIGAREQLWMMENSTSILHKIYEAINRTKKD